jgi:hypothetical protein
MSGGRNQAVPKLRANSTSHNCKNSMGFHGGAEKCGIPSCRPEPSASSHLWPNKLHQTVPNFCQLAPFSLAPRGRRQRPPRQSLSDSKSPCCSAHRNIKESPSPLHYFLLFDSLEIYHKCHPITFITLEVEDEQEER